MGKASILTWLYFAVAVAMNIGIFYSFYIAYRDGYEDDGVNW